MDGAIGIDGAAGLVEVDLETGNRTNLSSTVSGANFASPLGLALDSINDRIFVVDRGLEALITFDLSSGERVITSK